jgi:uncharacterized protein
MQQIIQQHLQRIAAENGFSIVYACETGSRAWGFASPDSDFDIRFIYVYPKEYYLSLEQPVEQYSSIFEDNGEVLDFNGWDLRKTLRLILGGNSVPYEWLQSPIVYLDNAFRSELWEQIVPIHQPRAAIHHYLGICHNSLKTGVVENKINIKKYFYVLRPLLAARWVATKGGVPPMEFAHLMEPIDHFSPFGQFVSKLLKEKETAQEGAWTFYEQWIQDYIETEMAFCKSVADNLDKKEFNYDAMNAFFRKWI